MFLLMAQLLLGGADLASGLSQPFIWDADNGMRNLVDILTIDLELDLTGWTLYEATGISADGLTIVGNGINPNGNYEGWIATIPEPTTLLPLSLGAVMLRKSSLRPGYFLLIFERYGTECVC